MYVLCVWEKDSEMMLACIRTIVAIKEKTNTHVASVSVVRIAFKLAFDNVNAAYLSG